MNTINSVNLQIVENIEADFYTKQSGEYIASFSFKGIEPLYSAQQLVMTYGFRGKCVKTKQQSNKMLLFETSYLEHDISFWDTIMGV